MGVITNIRLLDGPLAPISRADKVQLMAADLVRLDAFRNEGSASRTLLNQGYSAFDTLILLDGARQVAMQTVVAVEMSKP